jgi:hypothetical protein
MNRPGRCCPADYRYGASELAREADFRAETLYVVGGLYGNLPALDAVEALAAAEAALVRIVFNGDFHWFDAMLQRFGEVDRRVNAHCATRGNVETELSRTEDVGAGCGCAYPDIVDQGIVERSNRMLVRLRRCVDALPPTRESLAALPMTLVSGVGHLRIGIVHGDAESLAGWRFAHDALDEQPARSWLESIRAASRIDIFASSHTCLPALRDFSLAAGRLTIINNGAAGMPNFRATSFGVITRIGVSPSPHRPLYGVARDGLFIDALPVHYDQRRWLHDFLEDWPPGSPAHESYFHRLVEGPAFSIDDALSRVDPSPAITCEVTR